MSATRKAAAAVVVSFTLLHRLHLDYNNSSIPGLNVSGHAHQTCQAHQTDPVALSNWFQVGGWSFLLLFKGRE